MGHTIIFGGALVSMCNTDFRCPECNELYGEEWYYNRLQKAKHCVIYKTCTRCGIKIGISYDMRGDVVVWDKSTEKRRR